MTIENLTNPGAEPVDGDLIRISYPNGSTEQKQYWSHINQAPTRKEVILARLAEIDATSDKPRTRRELALAKAATKTWLQALDDEASTLRSELAGMP